MMFYFMYFSAKYLAIQCTGPKLPCLEVNGIAEPLKMVLMATYFSNVVATDRKSIGQASNNGG